MNKPKLDDRERKRLLHLRGTNEGQTLTKHLQAMLEYEKHLLVTLPLDAVRTHQGRAAVIGEVLSLLTE